MPGSGHVLNWPLKAAAELIRARRLKADDLIAAAGIKKSSLRFKI